MKPKITDNFLEPSVFASMQDLLFGPNFPYYYQSSVSDSQDTEGYFFNHHLYTNGSVSSWQFNALCLPVLEIVKPKMLIRAKINCYPRTSESKPYGWHRDWDNPHKVSLIMFNDCDGAIEIKGHDPIEHRANRCVEFDGSCLHRPWSQTDSKIRVNLNLNYS